MLIGAPQHGSDTQINIVVTKPSIRVREILVHAQVCVIYVNFKFTPFLFSSVKQPKKYL
jgi:hypothetical protein